MLSSFQELESLSTVDVLTRCIFDLMTSTRYLGVITRLEPDVLECEVKWFLESITMNQASGCDGIPVELFQILKDDAVKNLN